MNKDNDYTFINEGAANFIRDYAYKHGRKIYQFMKRYNIGESNYGKIMDAAAKGKYVIAHRLYGHHFIYDFPIDSPQHIGAFSEHLVSDLFTKQGLPILPGDILKDVGLLKFCNKLTSNWGFVNGFDVLAGTVAIYDGFDKFKASFYNDMSIDDFNDFAKTIGIGALELAILLSSCNPFLLIGALLNLSSGLMGMINDGAIIYFKNIQNSLSIEYSINTLNIEAYLQTYSIENSLKNISIENSLLKVALPYKF